MPKHFTWRDTTLVLHCHLQPKASRSEFSGLYNDKIKIRIAAPPVDGKANQALIEFLSAEFAVAKSQVTLVRGLGSREKTVEIKNPQKIPQNAFVETQ